jgi:hypothetical protein
MSARSTNLEKVFSSFYSGLVLPSVIPTEVPRRLRHAAEGAWQDSNSTHIDEDCANPTQNLSGSFPAA